MAIISGKSENCTGLRPSCLSSSQNENFVKASKKLVKTWY